MGRRERPADSLHRPGPHCGTHPFVGPRHAQNAQIVETMAGDLERHGNAVRVITAAEGNGGLFAHVVGNGKADLVMGARHVVVGVTPFGRETRMRGKGRQHVVKRLRDGHGAVADVHRMLKGAVPFHCAEALGGRHPFQEDRQHFLPVAGR